MNVLVIAPHPDDEAIGCGGSICLHVLRGDRVIVVFLTSGELGLKHLAAPEAWAVREAEAQAAAAVLGTAATRFLRLPDWYIGEIPDRTVATLASVLADEQPNVVYVPHSDEWHPDHRAALPALSRATAASGIAPPQVRTYEVWTPLSRYDHVEDVTAVMPQKLRAIRCYRSQLNGFRYDRAIRGLNQYRGALAAKCRYAEVFGSVENLGVMQRIASEEMA
jgi:N-acetylglucosamine malate deacetylase 1